MKYLIHNYPIAKGPWNRSVMWWSYPKLHCCTPKGVLTSYRYTERELRAFTIPLRVKRRL